MFLIVSAPTQADPALAATLRRMRKLACAKAPIPGTTPEYAAKAPTATAAFKAVRLVITVVILQVSRRCGYAD